MPPNYQLAVITNCSFEVLIHCFSGEDGKTRVRPTLKCLARGEDAGLSIGNCEFSP